MPPLAGQLCQSPCTLLWNNGHFKLIPPLRYLLISREVITPVRPFDPALGASYWIVWSDYILMKIWVNFILLKCQIMTIKMNEDEVKIIRIEPTHYNHLWVNLLQSTPDPDLPKNFQPNPNIQFSPIQSRMVIPRNLSKEQLLIYETLRENLLFETGALLTDMYWLKPW